VPENRLGFSLGWMATGQLAGALCGPLIGGYLADRTHDYRLVFVITAFFAVAATLVCALFVREDFVKHESADRSRPIPRRLIPMFVVVLLAQVVAFGVQPIVPLFIRELAGNVRWLATAAGAAFAVVAFADLIASPFLGKRSDRIGYRRVLLLSLAGVACFTIPQAFVRSVAAFIALRFGVGLFLGGVLPTANALIARSFPSHHRGQVFGITSSATFFGMFCGPLLGGLIAARFGFPAAFVTIGALAFANLVWVGASVHEPAPATASSR